MHKTYLGEFTSLEPHQYFVFGSNTQGRHGKGAALVAKLYFGAKYGQAKGLQGQSYAIITKDLTKKVHPSIPKEFIIEQIKEFYLFASINPNKQYLVAYSGKGSNLNSYSPMDMSHMFLCVPRSEIPKNIIFEKNFYHLMKSN